VRSTSSLPSSIVNSNRVRPKLPIRSGRKPCQSNSLAKRVRRVARNLAPDQLGQVIPSVESVLFRRHGHGPKVQESGRRAYFEIPWPFEHSAFHFSNNTSTAASAGDRLVGEVSAGRTKRMSMARLASTLSKTRTTARLGPPAAATGSKFFSTVFP
jgi:hypothetical protein